MQCYLCPRKCGVDRNIHTGICGADILPRVARVSLHAWEEPCISGTRGSGTVFFSGCNLNCIFCQNYVLRDGTVGILCTEEKLAEHFLFLQQEGAHNINLVTPSPHLSTIIPALKLAKQWGLTVPVVYNTNSYETTEALQSLEGLIDIYLPDFKYVSPILSKRFSHCSDYYEIAVSAISEMYRQVGTLCVDSDGIAVRGVLIRHLVLPSCLDDSRNVLNAIADRFPLTTHLSLMRQYAPTPNITMPPLNRKLTDREYDRIVAYCMDIGFTNVWIQEKESASLQYTPLFINT